MKLAISVCKTCGSNRISDRGELPPLDPRLFAGQASDAPIVAGHLFVCESCHLQFREPCLNDQQLLALYKQLPDTIWADNEPRAYWPRIQHAINTYSSNNTLLDIGCYRGDFLAWMPANWKLLGIEPSIKAAEFAAGRGITILGATIEDVTAPDPRPGVVTAFDVIEHIVTPLSFLKNIRDCLDRDGCIVIMTGATDTWPFRLFGRHYWYSALPEHVTFYNLAWFRWAANRLNMRVVSHSYFSSEPRDIRQWLRECALISLHTFVQFLKRVGVPDRAIATVPYGKLALSWRTVPWWKHSRDHILVVLKNTAPLEN